MRDNDRKKERKSVNLSDMISVNKAIFLPFSNFFLFLNTKYKEIKERNNNLRKNKVKTIKFNENWNWESENKTKENLNETSELWQL